MSDVTHTKPVAVAAPPFFTSAALADLRGDAVLVAMYFVSAEQGATSSLSGPQSTSGCTTGVTCSASPPLSCHGCPHAASWSEVCSQAVRPVAFGVYVAGEPAINAAIAIEEAGGLGDHHAQHATATTAQLPPRCRGYSSRPGLLTGTMVAGVTLGGLLGCSSARPRPLRFASAYVVSACPWRRSASSASV